MPKTEVDQEAAERGRKLREHRERAGLTREQLAPQAGVSVSTLVRVEGGGDARPETVAKIAIVLGLDPRELGFDDAVVGSTSPPWWFSQAQEQHMAALRVIEDKLDVLIGR